MESTGQPEKIQVSEDFRNALDKHYPEFQTDLRGKTEIKVFRCQKVMLFQGKGECTTYWLEGKRYQDLATHEESNQRQKRELGMS